MQAAWPIALLLCALLAGCAGAPSPTTAPPPPPAPDIHHVAYYRNGTLLALPAGAVLGSPLWKNLNVSGPEPNIGSTPDGSLFFNAQNTVLRSQDNGTTWKVVHDYAIAGGVNPNSDPMLWADPITSRVYQAPMAVILACSAIYWSDDHGSTWTSAPAPQCGRGVYDHQKLASGKPGPGLNPAAGVAWPTVVYMCYNGIGVTNCAVSYDGGETWPVDKPVFANNAGKIAGGPDLPAGSTNCASGQDGRPTVAPDGTVVVARGLFCPTPLVAVSRDSGLTWSTAALPRVANPTTLDPAIAFTPDGTMYLLVADGDYHMTLSSSKDFGATWQGPFPIDPPGVKSVSFAALSAGDNGRIAAAFLGTRDSGGNPTTANATARWHMFVVTSDDANTSAPAFTSYQVTPDSDPVQVGGIWQGGGGDPSRNLLDFIDSTASHGTFYVAYADGCTQKCSNNPKATPDMSRSSVASVAYLPGWSLLATAPR
ncbi:MAG: sialidase family protein [Thermoplasmatota archaeon]